MQYKSSNTGDTDDRHIWQRLRFLAHTCCRVGWFWQWILRVLDRYSEVDGTDATFQTLYTEFAAPGSPSIYHLCSRLLLTGNGLEHCYLVTNTHPPTHPSKQPHNASLTVINSLNKSLTANWVSDRALFLYDCNQLVCVKEFISK